MNSAIRIRLAAASAIGALGIASVASANQISVKFYGSTSGTTTVGTSAVAGVAPQQGHWNNYAVGGLPNSLTWGGGGSATLGTTTVIDNTGFTVGTSTSGGMHVSMTNNYTQGNSSAPGYTTSTTITQEDVNLFTGNFATNVSTINDTISIGGVPSAYTSGGYNLYVYFYSSSGTVADSATGQTFYVTTPLAKTDYEGATASNPGVSGTPVHANYAMFAETLATTTVTFHLVGGGQSQQFGLQIVPAPEPASLSLLALSSVGLLARRRGKR